MNQLINEFVNVLKARCLTANEAEAEIKEQAVKIFKRLQFQFDGPHQLALFVEALSKDLVIAGYSPKNISQFTSSKAHKLDSRPELGMSPY